MLVLSRKKDQTIVIDGGIEIQVLQLKGNTVKIGINAPQNVRIVRGELSLYSDMIEVSEMVDGENSESPAIAGRVPVVKQGSERHDEFQAESESGQADTMVNEESGDYLTGQLSRHRIVAR